MKLNSFYLPLIFPLNCGRMLMNKQGYAEENLLKKMLLYNSYNKSQLVEIA